MHDIPSHSMDAPVVYRIRVRGRLNQDWVDSMWQGMAVTVDTDCAERESVMVGEVVDQAQLLGIVNVLYNLGHGVIAIEELPSVTPSRDDEI